MDVVDVASKTCGQSVNLSAYVVADFKLATGESMPLVVRRHARSPETYVLRYVIVAFRTPGASPTTIRNVCQGIALGLSFLEDRKIDLLERLASGLFLSRDELASYANRCLSRTDGKGAVVSQYAKRRFLDFTNYMLWRLEAVVHRANRDDRRYLNDQRKAFEARIKTQCPRGNAGAQQNDRLGLSTQQRDLLLEVIDPQSPRNPFPQKLRLRNHAIVLLHFNHGLRAGEAAGLYRSDYKNLDTPAHVDIHVRQNNPDDRRRNPAHQKTLPRLIEVSDDTELALNKWIDHRADRSQFPEARKCRYLFTNKNGRELSLRAAMGIFERLREIYPELGPLASHVLRHDMNERWVETGEELGWNASEALEDQRYLNGWSENSSMPSVYSKSAIRRRANKRITDLQRKSIKD